MLKKVMALAATTAMLGVNAAAYALNTARSAVRSVTGSPAGEENPGGKIGTSIQPSIPPMAAEAPARKGASPAGRTKGVGMQKTAAAKGAARKSPRKRSGRK